MREFHPDKHTSLSSTDSDKKEAERMSIQLNTARTVLESPLFRAQHLLSLININDADNILDDEYQILDQNFLFQIMEIRTNIEATNDYQILQNILDQNRKIMKVLIKQIAAEFSKNDNNDKNHKNHKHGNYSIPTQNIETIRELLAKLTYYDRIEGEIKEKLPSRE